MKIDNDFGKVRDSLRHEIVNTVHNKLWDCISASAGNSVNSTLWWPTEDAVWVSVQDSTCRLIRKSFITR